MESKVNYVLVGLFVLVLTVVTIVAGMWLASDVRFTRYHPYVVYFNESVAGLNPNAPVKYRGVNVGRVEKMQIDPKNPTRVRILMDIASDTPIRTDTYAMLKVQGLTGIAFVELEGGAKGEPLTSPLPDGTIAEIPSKTSFSNRLDEALSHAALTIDQIGDRLMALLDQTTIESFHKTLHHLERMTAELDRDKKHLHKILTNADTFSSTLAQAGQSLPMLLNNINRLIKDYDHLSLKLSATAATLTQLGENLEKTSSSVGQDLRKTSHTLETEIRRLSLAVARAARDLSSLTRKLDNHPNALLYGNPQPPPGPGE